MNILRKIWRPIKYNHLRTKVKYSFPKTDTCNVVFIIQRTEVVQSVKSVIQAMIKEEKIEVYLLPIPRYDIVSENNDENSYKKTAIFCKQIVDESKVLVTEKNDYFDTLMKVRPQYVFLNTPYEDQYPKDLCFSKLAKNFKICYVPYGYNMSKKPFLINAPITFPMLANVYFLFSDNYDCYKNEKNRLLLAELLEKHKIVYDIGFPRFDLIDYSCSNLKISTVLWTPRWTSKKSLVDNETSSFFELKDFFIDYFQKHPDLHFIIRPHPLMFENYIKSGDMTNEEVDVFFKKISSIKNIEIDLDQSYYHSLSRADLLISDFSSIVIEYFMTGKPIVYLGCKKDLLDSLKKMYNLFYYPENGNVEKLIEKIIYGNDIYKEKRRDLICSLKNKNNNTLVGEKIKDIIFSDFLDMNNKRGC